MSNLKLYIAVLNEVPDYMVPTLVAHSVLSAHLKFGENEVYKQWLTESYRKVVLRVNATEFEKISQLECHLGYENTVLNAAPSCAVVCPYLGDTPNVLKFAKMWKPI